MRVVAGTARGRRLTAPKGRDVRPTSDRVREAIFSSLESLGVVQEASVVDLFAGTGALGVEALSRGAARAVFVDASTAACRVIEANLRATGMVEKATVVRSDVMRWLGERERVVDIALVDPPYAFDDWERLLDLLPARTAVIESDRDIEVGPRWRVLRRKRYGGTVVATIVTA
jgi:16S rRNA (guanine966-N2)-methyltransferase